uniref:Cytochrome P450 n=2 Tax=Manihot esculenta TaxID=3983 RepID=A0A2C9VIU1_MANES
MQWMMAELINHPNVFKKLREEIKSVVGTTRPVEDSDILNLHYLQAVVKETLRLYPLVPAIPRECRQDCKVGGFDIPKETAVLINAYSIMRDPELWDNPNEFYPEKFLHEEENQKKQNFNFVPFGGGRRKCLGSQLALCLMNITVASMVRGFDWKFAAGDGQKINMEAKAGMAMCMKHPLLCFPIIHFNPVSA